MRCGRNAAYKVVSAPIGLELISRASILMAKTTLSVLCAAIKEMRVPTGILDTPVGGMITAVSRKDTALPG